MEGKLGWAFSGRLGLLLAGWRFVLFFLLQYFPVLLQFEYTLDFITHDLTQAGSQGVAECLLYPVK